MAKFHAITDQPLEEESYFVSMTDMMVGLLFIFILMLMYFAMQYNKTTSRLESANDTRSQILEEIRKSLVDQKFPVEIDPQSGILRLNENVLRFEFTEETVNAKYEGVITALSNALADVLSCYSNEEDYIKNKCLQNQGKHWLEAVFIEGHTDNIGSLSSNLTLSAKRAVNTYIELAKNRQEIDSLKNADGQPLFSVSGYADRRPVPEAKNNNTDKERQMNRRIELRIIMATPKKNDISQVVIDDIKEKIE